MRDLLKVRDMEAVKASWRDRQICRAKYGRSLSPPHGKRERLRRRSWSLVLHRFGATLVFFNAPYFKKRVREVAATHPGIKWFIVDGSTINSIDSTGAAMLEALSEDLHARGIRLGFANPEPRFAPFWNAPEYRLYSALVRYSPHSNQPWMLAPLAGSQKHRKPEQDHRRHPHPVDSSSRNPSHPSHWRPMRRSLGKGNPLPKCSATNYLHVEEAPTQ
jgi:anti-anti-sigma regulatory factor